MRAAASGRGTVSPLPGAEEAQPGADQPAGGDVRGHPPDGDGDGRRGAGYDDEPDAGTEGRVVEPVLLAGDQVQESRVQRPVHPERSGEAAGERRLAQQGQVEHRLAASPLNEREAGKRGGGLLGQGAAWVGDDHDGAT